MCRFDFIDKKTFYESLVPFNEEKITQNYFRKLKDFFFLSLPKLFLCSFQGIVYIDKDTVGWRPIAKSWLDSRTPQEIHVSTLQFECT